MLTFARANPVRMQSPYPESDSGLKTRMESKISRDFLDKIVIKISLFTDIYEPNNCGKIPISQ